MFAIEQLARMHEQDLLDEATRDGLRATMERASRGQGAGPGKRSPSRTGANLRRSVSALMGACAWRCARRRPTRIGA